MIGYSILMLAVAASSQSDCFEAFNQQGRAGLHNCLSSELDETNENLRIAWVSALERAKLEDDRKKENDFPEFKEEFSSVSALTRAQRGWNTYRNNHCDTQELSMFPGNGGGALYLACMADLGRSRIADLQNFARNGQF